MSNKILKKEDKLKYKGGLFKTKVGNLVLTETDLSFVQKDKNIFSIPLKNIINVSAQKGLGNGVDHLYVSYKEGDQEKKVKIEHFAFWAGAAISNLSQLKEPYFRAWENTINDLRLGKVGHSSGLHDLEKLAELKENGVITEAEFTAKKKQLLNI